MSEIEKVPLPHDFFVGTGLEDTWALVRMQVLERLREENSSAENMVDLLLLERTSYIYAALRQHEAAAAQEWSEERSRQMMPVNLYKDLTKLLIAMIESLRAQRDKDFVVEEARREVIHAVVLSLKEALAPLPQTERKAVLDRVQAAFGDII